MKVKDYKLPEIYQGETFDGFLEDDIQEIEIIHKSKNNLDIDSQFERIFKLNRVLNQCIIDTEKRLKEAEEEKKSIDREIKSILDEIENDKKLLEDIKKLPSYKDYVIRKEREKCFSCGFGQFTRMNN